MSETSGEPGTPESPKTPNIPETPTTPTTPETQAIPATAATPAAAAAPPPGGPTQPGQAPAPAAAPRSTWGEAVSTTGGKIAVIVAGASLGLIALITAGLVVGAVARHVVDDRGHGPWAGDSREMPGPDHMGPGEQGPDKLPPGQERRGAGDLPELGLPGVGGPLHGEAVVPGEGTGTTTILFQRGEVTDVTADKLTVKSTDGFSATYTIGADSRDRLKKKVSTLAKGDEVTVIATKDDATTLRILKTGRAAPTS